MLRIALPRGRLFEETLQFFLKLGILKEPLEEGRKLSVRQGDKEYILVKPFDVPVYVENGVADLGVVGYDVLAESETQVYLLWDLGIGFCRMVVAGREEDREKYEKGSFLKVATKYPRIARRFFSERGIRSSIIPLSGSVELAPLLGLADVIVDLVQTGRTLKENHLVVFEEIMPSTAKLVCNRASYRNKREEILNLLNILTAN
ncbi:ATP phosphoribosyltransferase [Thermocrinis albus DSM 14484]|uniref:ATP phosphoribosyltransferase n=1 Tax=Thermocrinis albus (strain DSM 14484 / JCM 11386 / HI 11/12) TaxID=638303 RepID=D3SPJ6_THEAH|nr:ATP phosphoribosyltransferase [Thermocrinis albus]ADC89083.1 ATP phosphoribosyltransferase [Thermocrinis albus DSM 14484]